jgi:hypothetical protein
MFLCAPVPALIVGILTMKQFGVPTTTWLTNVAATFAGLVLYCLVRLIPPSPRLWTQFIILATAVATILLPFIAPGMMGVHRWVSLGGFSLQPSAIVLPFIITAVAWIARQHAVVSIASAVLTTMILALQPDAAQAFSFAVACSVLFALNAARQHYRAIGVLLLLAAAAASFTRNDPLPPVPHVEGIFALVASRGALWAVFGIAALLLLPLPFIATFARAHDRVALALAVYAGMTILASFSGTFPVPVMGYGASPILGYFIALALCDRASAISDVDRPRCSDLSA